MNVKIRSLFENSTIRYICIGGGVFIFELIVIYVSERIGLSAVSAVALSFWLGLLASFGLHKVITFTDHRTGRIAVQQFLAYCVLVLFNFGFTLVVVQALQPYLATGISRAFALGITVVWNFYLYKTRIFKLTDTEQPE